MSREIKFRVWIKNEKKYIPNFVEDNDAGDGYGPLEYDVYYLAPETGAIVKHHNHREFGDWMYSVEGTNANREVEIEQSTGLKDKNGKEIYEGDIVKCQRPAFHMKTVKDTNICTVRFKDGLFAFYDEKGKLYCDCIHNMTERKDVEIIGNIHENQELLEDRE